MIARVAIICAVIISVSVALSIQCRRSILSLRMPALRLSGNAPPPSDDLDALFDQIADMDPSDVPPELQQSIRDKIDATAPSDWEVRLRVMGFTPLTVAGYALAAVLIFLNTVLGTGWASTLIGINDAPPTDVRYIGRDDGPSPSQSRSTPIAGSRRAEIDAFVKENLEEIREIR